MIFSRDKCINAYSSISKFYAVLLTAFYNSISLLSTIITLLYLSNYHDGNFFTRILQTSAATISVSLCLSSISALLCGVCRCTWCRTLQTRWHASGWLLGWWLFKWVFVSIWRRLCEPHESNRICAQLLLCSTTVFFYMYVCVVCVAAEMEWSELQIQYANSTATIQMWASFPVSVRCAVVHANRAYSIIRKIWNDMYYVIEEKFVCRFWCNARRKTRLKNVVWKVWHHNL